MQECWHIAKDLQQEIYIGNDTNSMNYSKKIEDLSLRRKNISVIP